MHGDVQSKWYKQAITGTVCTVIKIYLYHTHSALIMYSSFEKKISLKDTSDVPLPRGQRWGPCCVTNLRKTTSVNTKNKLKQKSFIKEMDWFYISMQIISKLLLLYHDYHAWVLISHQHALLAGGKGRMMPLYSGRLHEQWISKNKVHFYSVFTYYVEILLAFARDPRHERGYYS